MRGMGTWFCALLAIAACCTTAQALVIHVPAGSFGVPGFGAGQFKAPVGVAVNDTSHDVYVVDRDNHRVQRFDSTGSTVLCDITGPTASESFSEPLEVAVDNSGKAEDPSNQDVYVVDLGRGVIDKFKVDQLTETCEAVGTPIDGSGLPEGKFESGDTGPKSIMGIAVDRSGSVWVALHDGKIYGFTNAVANAWGGTEVKTEFGLLSHGLGVDDEGDLYVNGGGGDFVKVTSSGSTIENLVGSDTTAFAVAVAPVGSSPEVYLDSRKGISAFTFGGEAIETFGAEGELTLSNGVAVDASDNMVYATDQTQDKVFRYEGLVLPTVALSPVTEQQTTSVTLNGTVNPEGSSVLSCEFEYATAVEFEQAGKYTNSAPCSPASPGSGSSPVLVHAHLAGLQRETEYDYRLVARNAAPIPSATVNATLITGPIFAGASTKEVSDSSVTLTASVDPNGGDTRYYFEYGTGTSYSSVAPGSSPPGVDIGAALGTQVVEAHVQNLSSGTRYHYRLIVEQSGETLEEPEPNDRQFVTQRAGEELGATDGRGWELVSPSAKKGALIEQFEQGGQIQAANGGDGIAYVTKGGSLGEPVGHITVSQVLSGRGSPGKWTTTDLTLPGRLPENEEPATGITGFQFEYHMFSPDLGFAAVEPQTSGTPLLSPEATERTLYLRNDSNGSFMPLITPANVVSPPAEEPSFPSDATPPEWEMHLLVATPDLHHVLFKTPMALVPPAVDEEKIAGHKYTTSLVQSNLYEWSEGRLQLVNVLPDGEAAHGPSSVAPGVRLAGTTAGAGRGRGGAPRSVSEDGQWVAWAWGEPYSEEGRHKYRGLFVRNMTEETTMRVGGASAIYQTMSSDGSRLFYLEGGDLYAFDTVTRTSTDLTAGPGAEAQETVSDVSEDGSSVYFVAKGALTADAHAGEDNLYLLREVEGAWSTTYLATLSEEDQASWVALGLFAAPFLPGITSRVSPDGRFFTFMSNRPLSRYDNRDVVSGARDEEVFLYDATSGRLVCASCNPTGGRPTGVLDTAAGSGEGPLVDKQKAWAGGEGHWLAAILPGWDNINNDPATYQPRFLSDSGRLFFDSPDALVPQDTNGLEDVYEFEPVGVGGCAEGGSGYDEATAGCLSLISSSTATTESSFYDASESGGDVFFDTTAKLVNEDFDHGYDIYDAHVCTVVAPCPAYLSETPPCSEGESCKTPPSPQPELFGVPPSATFDGVGNFAPAPVAKAKPLSNAQKLARALHACKRKRGKLRRACIDQAHRRYPVGRGKGKTALKRRGG